RPPPRRPTAGTDRWRVVGGRWTEGFKILDSGFQSANDNSHDARGRQSKRSATDGQPPLLLTVMKVLSVRAGLCHTLGDENQGLLRRTGAPAPTRRPTMSRRALGR